MCTPSKTFKPQTSEVQRPVTKTLGERRTSLNIATQVLDGLTRDEVRALASHLGIRQGRNKTNTVANLLSALKDGKARIKSLVTISSPPPEGQPFGEKVLLVKKLRTYKPDRIISPIPEHVTS